MALHRWPTDPPGKAASHKDPWEKHKKPASAGTVGIGGKPLAPGAWERGDFLAALLQGSKPAGSKSAATTSAPDRKADTPGAPPPDPLGQPLPVDAAYDDDIGSLTRN